MKKRYLFEIAEDIYKFWPDIYSDATLYVHAMMNMYTIKDVYSYEKASYIIQEFLNNSNSWKGEKAKQIKTELKQLLNEK